MGCRIQLLLAMLLIGAACGGEPKGSMVLDMVEEANADAARTETGECIAECAEKECGTDGCGGECGSCAPPKVCGDDGMCAVQSCASSKECPDGLVCEKTVGQCVECSGEEDCQEGAVCGTDFQCHLLTPCASDKDCQASGEVCDKDQGICTECLGPEDCPEEEHCSENWCIPDVCAPGESVCDDNAVSACTPDGGGWESGQLCTESQYCEEGQCFEFVCLPEIVWCDGDVLSTCAADGKSVASTVDCAQDGLHCFEGECIETMCQPLATFCIDPATKGICWSDGTGYEIVLCPDGHYCEGAACLPWLCTPGTTVCVDNVATECDSSGSKITSQVDCGDDVCVDGECKPLLCVPGTVECLSPQSLGQCESDGLSLNTIFCKTEESCLDGACLPWQCPPNQPVCVGQTATTCDGLGLAALPGGEDCAQGGTQCVDGQCLACQPQCIGKQCGPDGCGGECGQCPPGQQCGAGECLPPGVECDDGNDIDWDGCTDGKISEFRLTELPDGDQQTAIALALPDGDYGVVYRGLIKDPQTGLNHAGVMANLFSPGVMGHKAVLELDGAHNKMHWAAVLPDGKVAVVMGSLPPLTAVNLAVQVIQPGWAEVTEPVVVSQFPIGAQEQAYLAPTIDGGFAVAWISDEQDGNDWGVVARFFDENGEPKGDEFVVNTTTDKAQRKPCLLGLADGSVLAVWNSYWQDGNKEGVFAQIVKADGTKVGAETQLNATTEDNQAYATLALVSLDVIFAAWEGQDGQSKGVIQRTFDLDLTPLSGEETLNTWQLDIQSIPRASWVPGTGGVVVWISKDQDGDDYGVFARRFDAEAQKSGDEFGVNSFTDYSQSAPTVDCFSDGSFVVAWQSQFQYGDNSWSVYAQRFDQFGNKLYR